MLEHLKGYVEDSACEEALLLFREVQHKGLTGDKVTMVSLLLACTHLGALEVGIWLHAYIMKKNIEVDVGLGMALVDTYAKCDSIINGVTVFEELARERCYDFDSIDCWPCNVRTRK